MDQPSRTKQKMDVFRRYAAEVVRDILGFGWDLPTRQARKPGMMNMIHLNLMELHSAVMMISFHQS